LSAQPGIVVLLADSAGGHVTIEVAEGNATSSELETLARRLSRDVGIQLEVYATLATADAPRAVREARRLLRFNPETPASGRGFPATPAVTAKMEPVARFSKSPV
jgi:hypothetical protein